jgi:hypothetical protein
MAIRTLKPEDKKDLKKDKRYKCSLCGEEKYGHQLQIAHIKDKAKYRGTKGDDKYNTLPLCHNCHHDFDYYKKKTKTELNTWSDYKKLLLKLKKQKQEKRKPTKVRKKPKTKKSTTKKKGFRRFY